MDSILFESLAGTYGADMKRWPEQHRQAWAEFAARNASAQEILARHQKLDAMLDLDAAAKVSAALKGRILAAVAVPDTFIVWFSHEVRRFAMLFLIVAVAGAWAGTSAFGDMGLPEKSPDQIFIVNALGPNE